MRSFSDNNIALEQCKEYFKNLLTATEREGMDELLKYIERKSGFFSAPSSTKYHESREGGLLRHSLNVYIRLRDAMVAEAALRGETLSDDTLKSIAIVALLHDICKADQYEVGSRNVKNEQGQWDAVPFYKMNDNRLPFGHGEKSQYIVSSFIKLTREEAIAIRFHMGEFETDKDTGLAYNRYELAFMLHVADLQATYLDEKGTNFGNI